MWGGFANLWERGRLDLTVEALVFSRASRTCSPNRRWKSPGTASTGSVIDPDLQPYLVKALYAPVVSHDGAAWRVAETLVEYRVVVPDEDRAGLVAAELAERGHRWVCVRPVYLPYLDPQHALFGKPEFSRPELDGWWQVCSLVDEETPSEEEEFHQRACERAEVAGVARTHGGFTDGDATGLRETMLKHLDRAGLVHELSADETYVRRRAAIAAFAPVKAVLVPCTPLDSGDWTPDDKSFLELIRTTVGELPDASEDSQWWLTDEVEELADDYELLFELSDSVMHQGTCYPHTPRGIPLLAALAANRAVPPAYRAVLLLFLAEAATAGRRRLAADADRRVALRLGFDESADESATRRTVEAVAPGLLATWENEGEAVRFGLAVLAAACADPVQWADIRPYVRLLSDDSRDEHRTLALQLIDHLIGDDAESLKDVVARAFGATDTDGLDVSPFAPIAWTGLSVLELMAQRQLSSLITD
ncbi:hypothetical protein [Rhizohabitans arisaemae]|uniref:hypothetical protein n=1 Tax=Rhizohabitans arisaemae TaxID=2720610 RepID=UPI0024B24B21|nr:hypothetical protein [Rhizohabitans arisaemae]